MKYQRVTRERPTESGLDRALNLTKFDDPLARRKAKLPPMSLRQLAAKIPNRVATSKAKLPLLKLATFGDAKTRKGSLRSNANMLTIEGVEGDYDGGKMTVDQAAAKLDDAGLAALIYTSPSHTPDKPRWRVMCPTSAPLPPTERECLMARVMGVLDGALSPESFTRSQTYFYGTIEGQGAPIVELIEGRPVDLATELDAGALDKHGKPYSAPVTADNDDDDDGDLWGEPDTERITAALDAIPVEIWDEREHWLTIGMALHNGYRGDEEGFALWDAASQFSDKYDADDQRHKWESFGAHTGKPVTIGTLFRLAKEHGRRPATKGGIPLIDPGAWQGVEPPEREWIWSGRIPQGQATYFTGPGSAGKSLLSQQMATCVALGMPMFGIDTTEATSIYLTCEDDASELHRRQAAICESMGVSLRSLSGRLHLASLVGAIGNELATFDSEGRMTVTAAYERVEAVATETGATFIILDNVAHLFAGNENIRNQAAAFVSLMNRLATTIGGSILFLGHPNKAGQEYSGSTAWENQVRSRLFLNWGEVDEVTKLPLDPDARVLTTGKANYGRKGNAVEFRWHNGAFMTDDDLGADEARQIAAATDEAIFMQCLATRTAQGRRVSESPSSRTYAPKVFAEMGEGRAVGRTRFQGAMERLFQEGKIERGTVGRINGKDMIGLCRTGNDDDI